jgi:hypothetical protein
MTRSESKDNTFGIGADPVFCKTTGREELRTYRLLRSGCSMTAARFTAGKAGSLGMLFDDKS